MVVVLGAVVVVLGAVVVVLGAVVVVLGAVVVGAVVVAAGAVVAVVGVVVGLTVAGAVVVDSPAFTRSLSMAVMAAPGGFGIDLPEGTKATVMSWPSASRTELDALWIVGVVHPRGP